MKPSTTEQSQLSPSKPAMQAAEQIAQQCEDAAIDNDVEFSKAIAVEHWARQIDAAFAAFPPAAPPATATLEGDVEGMVESWHKVYELCRSLGMKSFAGITGQENVLSFIKSKGAPPATVAGDTDGFVQPTATVRPGCYRCGRSIPKYEVHTVGKCCVGLLAEPAAPVALVEKLRELHRRSLVEGGLWCHACGTSYPCQTTQLLEQLELSALVAVEDAALADAQLEYAAPPRHQLVYLASPYSHPDPAVREQRFAAACRATTRLIEAGEMIFSPIVHSHPLVEHGAGTDWQTWQHYDRSMIDYCGEVRVLMLDGWQESVGVKAEIAYGTEHTKRVTYVEPEPAPQEPRAPQGERLGTFTAFSAANLARCEASNGFNHTLNSWEPEQWTNAIAGEVGEACNVAKKLLRHRQGVRGNLKAEDQSPEALKVRLAHEIADVVIYADLAIQALGLDPGTIIQETFNQKSREIGWTPLPPAPQETGE